MTTPLQDLDIVMRLYLIDKLFNDTTNQIKVSFLLSEQIQVTEQQVEIIFTPEMMPGKGHQIHALLGFGFTPSTIANWLNITEAGVSWHKTNPPKKPYQHKGLQYMKHTRS